MATGFGVCSSGDVPEDMWKEHIKKQEPSEPDDPLRSKPPKARPESRNAAVVH
jgi:hypothetical protein